MIFGRDFCTIKFEGFWCWSNLRESLCLPQNFQWREAVWPPNRDQNPPERRGTHGKTQCFCNTRSPRSHHRLGEESAYGFYQSRLTSSALTIAPPSWLRKHNEFVTYALLAPAWWLFYSLGLLLATFWPCFDPFLTPFQPFLITFAVSIHPFINLELTFIAFPQDAK